MKSERTLAIYECDRCGNRGEFSESRQYAAWANITTQYKDGSALMSHGYQADLCTECAADLAEWFRAGRIIAQTPPPLSAA